MVPQSAIGIGSPTGPMLGFTRKTPRKHPPGTRVQPEVWWDLHCHLLPGVDDGVRTIDEAVEAIRAVQTLGYRASVLTPHIYHGLYPNTRATLERALAELRAALAAAGIDHPLHLAAEYFADEHLIALIEREPLLAFGPRSAPHVLVEYAYLSEPLLWADALSALLRKGYTPVLAHIERYRFVVQAPELWLARFAELGVRIQCNIGSLAGQYGPEAFHFARRMRDQRVPTFWGTDLHRPGQVGKFIAPGLTHLTEIGEVNPTLRDLPQV